MRRLGPLATTCGVLTILILAVASVATPPQLRPGSDRDPLAFQLDGGDVWHRPGDASLARAGADPLLRVPPDEFSAALMESTSLANITATVQRLQDFGSRYVVVDSCWAAGYWVRDRFLEHGYSEVRLDTFRTLTFQDSVAAMNVIAFKEGTTRPSEYVVLGGHYDSVTAENFDDPLAPAPGAEDNATAVAGVLEAARILRDVPTDRSIIFACWSAEEEGLWGSRDFVARAVRESLDIVVYLNMDCIGYLESVPDVPPVIVFTDSLSFSVAGYMQTLCEANTPYALQTCVRPIGASDHNSFWEAGFNVIDTGTTISSPYRHTPLDTIDNIDLEFARAIAAVNVAATAAAAGVTGEDPNLPPETVRIDNCVTTSPLVTVSPTLKWGGVDFDGEIAFYEYALEPGTQAAGDDVSAGAARILDWRALPASQTSITFTGLSEGEYSLWLRATDDDGAVDPSPVVYAFITDPSFRPSVTIDANFLPGPRTFASAQCPVAVPVTVYENERLLFTVDSDAGHYCGRADSVAVALNDSTSWSDWEESPWEFELRPGPGDTALFFRTRDENRVVTLARLGLRPVEAPMNRPLLHVDDWFGGDVPETVHDEFYAFVLDGESCHFWDPFEHIEGYVPTLPSMEELGRYRTVIWTLDWNGGFLRNAQAESAYHYVEGFVRAGGNLILEGQSALMSFSAREVYFLVGEYGPGDFIYEHVGVESAACAGTGTNGSNPTTYGYTFLGGLAVGAHDLPDVRVDTLVKWSDGYQEYGGLPRCEVVRPTGDTDRLYLFDSYLNPTFSERPCATLRRPDDGTGTVAFFGFPLYYLESEPAKEALGLVLDALSEWQRPSELVYFAWDAAPDSVLFQWYLSPQGAALGCDIERADGITGGFAPVNGSRIQPTDGGRYTFVDTTSLPSSTYVYRLRVVERWGGTTTRGPWELRTPTDRTSPWLERPRPNPFRDCVELHYGVAADHRWLSVAVYDVAGRLVRTLEEGPAQTGEYDTSWNGRNERGETVASGVYFVRARVGPDVAERKVVLLR